MQTHLLYLQLLGKPHLWADQQPINLAGTQHSTLMLLGLLAKNAHTWLTYHDIAQQLAPSGYEFPVHTAIQELTGLLQSPFNIPSNQIVQKEKNACRLGKSILIQADFQEMQTIHAQQCNNLSNSKSQLLIQHYRLLALYQGDFANDGKKSPWQAAESMLCQCIFMESVCHCCEILWEMGCYKEIVQIHEKVARIRKPCNQLLDFCSLAQAKLKKLTTV